MCGYSVCKVCSDRKKDNKRICDLCYYKNYYSRVNYLIKERKKEK